MGAPLVCIGFGPIPEINQNYSQQILDMLPSNLGGNPVEKVLIPFAWDKAGKQVKMLMESWKTKGNPLAVFIFCGRPKPQFTIEKFAYNYMNGTDHNNEVRNNKIIKDDITRIPSSANVEKILKESNVPAELDLKLSINPGRFISNFSYFILLNGMKNQFPILMMQLPSQVELNVIGPYVQKILENTIKK